LKRECETIKVFAKQTIKEEHLKEVLTLCDKMIEETRKEEGCISYELFQDINAPYTFAYIEEWESPEHLAAHTKSPHYQEIIPKIAEMRTDSEVTVLKKVK